MTLTAITEVYTIRIDGYLSITYRTQPLHFGHTNPPIGLVLYKDTGKIIRLRFIAILNYFSILISIN